jgi:hypothetical protein
VFRDGQRERLTAGEGGVSVTIEPSVPLRRPVPEHCC